MSTTTVIHWFRQDLRLADNPALTAANKAGTVLPIYIHDKASPGEPALGAASKVWLHYALLALDNSLDNKLSLYLGDALSCLKQLIKQYNIQAVYWNRCYEPWQISRDTTIKKALEAMNVEVHTTNGLLLWEPWTVTKADGAPYKVFTPFYRKGCLKAQSPRTPLHTPRNLVCIQDKKQASTLDALQLLPKTAWDDKVMRHWKVGEKAAHKRLKAFLNSGIENYKEGRNFPAKQHVSRLSPHLHFGELSPNQAFYAAQQMGDDNNIDCFCSELGWREFSYTQLYYNPDLPKKNLQEKFDKFPWRNNKKALKAWQQGQTGIPIVDAGMRELWQTGYMHNRVRMIVGSFLVKNLLMHWQHGEQWFWDCLVDADLASNSASWQWVAGCGADAAPFFRIFNPVLQGQKFDPEGEYVKHYVPALKALPKKYIFNPWEAPESVLAEAKITLGKDYPEPIVDLKHSRESALSAFKSLK